MIKTASFNDIPSYILEDYSIYEVKNVKSIKYHHKLFDKSMYPFGYDIELNETDNIVDKYYFFVDTLFNDAFAHWVFESGIYIPLFKKLKEKYPSIVFYFKEIKYYKLALLKAFNINECVTEIEPNNIICFATYQSFHIFLPEYTQSNDIMIDSKYISYLNKFYKLLVKINKKDIDILYLPRGNKENFKGNNRIINIQDLLIEYINSIPNCKILYTDKVTNFNEQLEIISRAKVILLDYGSSLNVNGFFANNSSIIVIGYDIHHEMQQILNYIYKDTIKRNKIIFIHKKSSNDGTIQKFNFDYNEVVEIIQKTLKETLLHIEEN
jgi:capsular polysaccharide biosynthesis protein